MSALPEHIRIGLENIYISPLELCNLNCKACYTHKTKNILSNDQILNFLESYSGFIHNSYSLSLKSILFCGGEVFTLPSFIPLVNQLLSQKIFVSVITNGTIDKLDQISDPQNCQLLVSLDGPKEVHDQNRGQGNFDKTINFIKHALELGFPVEIMFLVTPDSYPYLDSFSEYLKDLTSTKLNVNYITQKTIFYTDNHPLSNQKNQKSALTPTQIINIKKNYTSIPSKNFGCFQLSLQSNGHFYGCCESPETLGTLADPINKVVENFLDSLSPCLSCSRCQGCCAPDFLCGYKKELSLTSCLDVVKSFN